MRKIIMMAAACILAGCSGSGSSSSEETGRDAAGTPSALRFRDGTFRIAQFTDMHWGSGSTDVDQSEETIRQVIASQDVDLCVFTGDIVTNSHGQELWNRFIRLMEECGKPYVVLMGNHDRECVPGDSIYAWLRREAPHCINSDYVEGISGYGNKALPVLSEKTDSVRLVIYGIDSNDYYSPDPENSYYDFIHPDQTNWYISESEKYKVMNGGMPIPSLAFFHICVPEYWEVVREHNYYGYQDEPCCPAGVNMGFFGSAFVQQDVVGMFVGHDHTNDFIGMYRGIALAYGRQTGAAGMDRHTPMGGRIIEMSEGLRPFKTWIATPAGSEAIYYYPSGFNSSMQTNPLPSRNIRTKGNGVKYTYYEGDETMLSTTEMMGRGRKAGEGVAGSFDLGKARVADHFGFQFDTWFLAEETAPYLFQLSSDDGATFYVDEEKVIDCDGSHTSTTKKYYVGLEKGYHHLHVNYFEDCEGEQLRLMVGSTFMELQDVPKRLLFVAE